MPGILDTDMPWLAKLMALLLSGIPDLEMGRGRYRESGVATRSPYGAVNEMQDVMHRAQEEETVAPAEFNPWMMQNIPDWIVPQDPTYAKRLYPHMGGQLGAAMKAGPGEYGLEDIQNLFGALQDPYVHKGIPRRHEPLRVVAPDVREAQERERTGREEVTGILEKHGIGTSLEALQELQKVFGQKGMETITPGMYPEEAPEPTAYDRNLQLQYKNRAEYMRLRDMVDEGGMFTGDPQEFAKFKVLEGQFREEEEEPQVPRASIGPITALDKMIEDAENAGARRNAQMLRSKLMRAQLEAQGLPYDTSEEDDLLAQLRGKNVDWEKVEAENPDLKWGYIWEQLGTQR